MVRASAAEISCGSCDPAALLPINVFSLIVAILANVTEFAANWVVPTPPSVIAMSLALAVIPVPPITFRVTEPAVPPPVKPVPATTPEMSPLPSSVIHPVPLLNFRALVELL